MRELLDSVALWVTEVEATYLSSRSTSSQLYFSEQEAREISNRFLTILNANNILSPDDLELMFRAITDLVSVMEGMCGSSDILVQLVESSFRSMSDTTKTASNFVSQSLNNQYLDVVNLCAELGEKNQLLEGLAVTLLKSFSEAPEEFGLVNKTVLKSLNSLLSGSEKTLREVLFKNNKQLLESVVDLLYTCGDYETQTSVVEVLHRLVDSCLNRTSRVT